MIMRTLRNTEKYIENQRNAASRIPVYKCIYLSFTDDLLLNINFSLHFHLLTMLFHRIIFDDYYKWR